MSNSIDEALQEAIDELLTKEWVISVQYLPLNEQEENKPCNIVAKLLSVYHKVNGETGVIFSHKIVYINKINFTYNWHYAGARVEPNATPTEDFFTSKLNILKNAYGFSYVEITSCDENKETILVEGLKESTDKKAIIFTFKAWKTGQTTFDYLIIDKKTVE